MTVNYKENKKLELAVGYIKTRRDESKAMDMAERMINKASEEGCQIVFLDVDRTGSRDIDRVDLDDIHMCMERADIGHLFIRSTEDITDNPEDFYSFLRIAASNDVMIHVVDVDEPEKELEEVWDGGCGC